MYSEFAYSAPMQVILTVVNIVATFIFYYLTATLILELYGTHVSKGRKALFAIIAGNLAKNGWIYLIYFIGGKVNFSSTIYAFVTVPNPFQFLLFYYIGMKTLKLSPIRSVRLMSHAFVYIVFVQAINYLIGFTLFPQKSGSYNYLTDTLALLADIAANIAILLTVVYLLRKKKISIPFRDGLPTKGMKLELLYGFERAAMIYILIVFPTISVSEKSWQNFMMALFLACFFTLGLAVDCLHDANGNLQNKSAYIHVLRRSIDDFSAIKHDMYNTMQTYSGYLALGDLEHLSDYHEQIMVKTLQSGDQMDIIKHIEENPEIVKLLLDYLQTAESLDIQLRIMIRCPLQNMPMPNHDLCVILSQLLDIALTTSVALTRQISFLIEQKTNGSFLFVIDNTLAGPITLNKMSPLHAPVQEESYGGHLAKAREILDKYSHCTLRALRYETALAIYLELLPQ